MRLKEFIFNLNNKFFKISKFLRKYNYDINKVVGIKDESKYILYADKKLIRIYRGKLKSEVLLSSYLPIEDAIFYNFEVEKSVLDKVNIVNFIETKIYEEAGVEETEEYEIKYKIIDKLKNDKFVKIETVIIPTIKIKERFSNILKETGYIDYISFPAFSFKSLYEEKILKEGNDLFIVILYDKIFLSLYSEGDLVSIITLTGGLNKIFETLSELNIKGFNEELFKKLLSKKGILDSKYLSTEEIVLKTLKEEFFKIAHLLIEEISKFKNNYTIDSIDRIFITSEYGKIQGLDEYFKSILNISIDSFEFYEKYNLDRLPVNPFLFLGMLEAHHAYKANNLVYNFSIYLRPPTFFYRPSGIMISTIFLSTLFLSIYPFSIFLYNKKIEKNIQNLSNLYSRTIKTAALLNIKLQKLTSNLNAISKEITSKRNKINNNKKFIKEVYMFKFSYLPKSQELVDILYLIKKNNVLISSFSYVESNKSFNYLVYSNKEENIPKLIKNLIDSGFSVYFDKIYLKNGKYTSKLRITK